MKSVAKGQSAVLGLPAGRRWERLAGKLEEKFVGYKLFTAKLKEISDD